MRNKVFVGIFIIVFIVAFSLIGCAKKGAVSTAGTQPAAEQKAPEAAAPAEKPKVAEAPVEEGQKKAAAEAEGAATPLSGMEYIYFDYDKYNIKPESRDTLQKLAAYLKNNGDAKLRIEGNCDERGTQEYNLALGERRANSAKSYLVSLGVDKDRISTVSYGKERPVAAGHDEAAWAKNRNAQFVLL